MQGSAYFSMLCELMPPVGCYASELLVGNLAEHTDHGVSDCFRRAIRNLGRQQVATFPVHLCNEPRATLSTFHCIALPVPQLAPQFGRFRAFRNPVGYLILPLFVDFSVRFARFPFSAQMECVAVSFSDVAQRLSIHQAVF